MLCNLILLVGSDMFNSFPANAFPTLTEIFDQFLLLCSRGRSLTLLNEYSTFDENANFSIFFKCCIFEDTCPHLKGG